MILLKNKEDLNRLHKANLIVAEALQEIKTHIKSGISTAELDSIAERYIRKRKGIPAFKGYRGYPATLCVSINEEVVHGIPGPRKLKKGDIVSLDIGVFLDGYYGDAAITIGLDNISLQAQRLMKTTEESLYAGIEKARAGNRLSDHTADDAGVDRRGVSLPFQPRLSLALYLCRNGDLDCARCALFAGY